METTVIKDRFCVEKNLHNMILSYHDVHFPRYVPSAKAMICGVTQGSDRIPPMKMYASRSLEEALVPLGCTIPLQHSHTK